MKKRDCASLANHSAENVTRRLNVRHASSATSCTAASVYLPACQAFTRRMTTAAHRATLPVPPVVVLTTIIASLVLICIMNSTELVYNIVLLATGPVTLVQDPNNACHAHPVVSVARSNKVEVLVWHVANATTIGRSTLRFNSVRTRRLTFVCKVMH